MIEIARNEKEVTVSISLDVYTKWKIPFYFQCSDKLYAELLESQIKQGIRSQIEQIRQDEYEAGWRDAKAKKRPKRTCFASTFTWRNK